MYNYLLKNKRESFSLSFLIFILGCYLYIHPGGVSTDILTNWGNQCIVLGLVAIAQFFAVLVRGLDLSVGAIMAFTNTIASYLVVGTGLEIAGLEISGGLQIAFGSFIVLLVGVLCGLLNGLIIVYGRIQPIVVTLATAAVFTGLALLLRPTPDGEIDFDLADAMTLDVWGIPVSILITFLIIILFWIPLKRTGFGLSLYAIGSLEKSAFQSGISVNKVRIAAFGLNGFFAGLAGSYIGFITTTGDAGIANSYTLNSIAAVVIGGVALRGGIGTLTGSLIGAFILQTITSLMFFSGLPPLAQPFVEGVVLAIAIGLGSLGLLKIHNRLKIFQ